MEFLKSPGISIGDDSTVPTSNMKEIYSDIASVITENHETDERIVELIDNMKWDKLIIELKRFPEQATQKLSITLEGCFSRGFPLHLAVSKEPPVEVIEVLIAACPIALKSREERWGRLPIHIACMTKASTKVLKVLVDAYEESLRVTDKTYSRLPLHYACLLGSSPEIFYIVNAEQRALIFKDGKGETPMDLAQRSDNIQRQAIIESLKTVTMSVKNLIVQRKNEQGAQPYKAKRRNSMPSVENNCNRGEKKGKTSRRKSFESKIRSNSESSFQKKKEQETRPYKTRRRNSMSSVESHNSLSSRGEKKGRTSRRKSLGTKTGSESEQSNPVVARKTKSNRKKRGSFKSISSDLSEMLQNQRPSNSSEELSPNFSRYGAEHSIESQPRIPCDQDSLSKFFKETGPNDSDADCELDHKTRGVQSLPTQLSWPSIMNTPHTTLNNDYVDKSKTNLMIEDVNTKQCEEESEEGQGALKLSDDSAAEGISELIVSDDSIDDLEIKRQTLIKKYNAIQKDIIGDERSIKLSKDIVSKLQLRLSSLRRKLRKEESALSIYESSLKTKRRDLLIHEEDIKIVTLKIDQQIEEKNKMKSIEDAAHVVDSNSSNSVGFQAREDVNDVAMERKPCLGGGDGLKFSDTRLAMHENELLHVIKKCLKEKDRSE